MLLGQNVPHYDFIVELNAGGSAWAPTADQLTAIAKLIAPRLP